MKHGKILVVDDNQGIRNALKLLLTPQFAEVQLIASPKTLVFSHCIKTLFFIQCFSGQYTLLQRKECVAFEQIGIVLINDFSIYCHADTTFVVVNFKSNLSVLV